MYIAGWVFFPEGRDSTWGENECRKPGRGFVDVLRPPDFKPDADRETERGTCHDRDRLMILYCSRREMSLYLYFPIPPHPHPSPLSPPPPPSVVCVAREDKILGARENYKNHKPVAIVARVSHVGSRRVGV